MPSVDIIIVNWNSGGQLRRCLESIAKTSCDGFLLKRVVVVDNASSDGSASDPNNSTLPMYSLFNSSNVGFAKACNQGFKGSNADYLLFLNPDTVLFGDSLTEAIRFMEMRSSSRVGICGIQLINEWGQISRTCARFPSPRLLLAKSLGLSYIFAGAVSSCEMEEWDHKESRYVDQVIGAFFLVRSLLFRQLGGLDERFFLYHEEVDFSFRARAAGWRSFYLANVQAYHRGGGTSRQVKSARLFYSLHSRLKYSFKHFGVTAGIIVVVATLVIEPFTRLTLHSFHRSWGGIRETVGGYARLWSAIWMSLTQRQRGIR